MLRCVYTLSPHTNMLAKCTQRHTQRGLSWVLVLGFFQWYFHLWIILPETLQDGCPGSWDLRLLEVPPVNSWRLKVGRTATVLWNIWCHVVQSAVNTPGPGTFPLPAFRPAHTYLYESPSPLSEHFFLHRYGPSFDSAQYSFLTIPVYSVCRHVTASNVFKIRSHLGPVTYKGRESTNLLADIK